MNTYDLNFIYKYFGEEKQASLIFLVLGMMAIILGIIFYFFVHNVPELDFYRGAAIPLFIVGLIMFIAGFGINSRTKKQQTDIAYNIGLNPKGYISETEMPRMKKVMSLFVTLRWAEIAITIAGAALVLIYYNKPEKLFLFGVGLALTVLTLIMLATDFYAEKRANQYKTHLQLILNDKEE